MAKKRIAIQLFGHLRTFRDTHKSLQKFVIEPNLKKGYNVDVFIHTWDKVDHNDLTPWNNPKGENREQLLNDNVNGFIAKNYAPKAIIIEDQIQLTSEEEKIIKEYNIPDKRTKNMAHTFSSVNKLREEYEKEHNFKYDAIIVTRPDIIFYEELPLEYIFRDFKQDEINSAVFYTDIPLLDQTYCSINNREFICGIDLLMIAGTKALSAICEQWYNKKEYLKQPVPEKTIAQAIYKHNIYLNLMQYPKHFCWNIKRPKKETVFKKIISVLMDMVLKIVNPILLFSPQYQKNIFRDCNSPIVEEKTIKKVFLLPLSKITPVKSWRKKLRNQYK